MKNWTFLILTVALAQISSAQQVTFSEHIAPIIYNNCTTCHRPGEVAPFSLTNYEQTAAYGTMIQYVTGIRYMPPWKADPTFSHFLGERFLTDEQIQLIDHWVQGGMLQGDPSLEPPLPEFPTGSVLGEPDLVLSFAEAYHHEGDLIDQYQIFVLPTGLTEDRDIAAVEVRPGNSRIVHHALLSYDDSGQAAELDADTPEYGYPGSGGGWGVANAGQRQFPGYVPGQRPRFFPEGIGQKLPAGSDLLIQMHYAPVPADESDSSSINIFFKDEPVQRFVSQHVMLPFFGTLTNGPFVIQAGQVKTFHGVWKIEEDLSLLGVGPHMHLLGKAWEVILIHPDGDTTNVIRIPEWNFNWQGGYSFPGFVVAKAGSEIHAYATYDNTSQNSQNPNDPPQTIGWGESTTDEMYYLPFLFVDYQPGDEDVVFEDGTTGSEDVVLNFPGNKLFPVFPNPSSGELTAGFSLSQASRIRLELANLNGQVVKTLINNELRPAGRHQAQVSTTGLTAGTYVLTLKGDNFVLSEKVILR